MRFRDVARHFDRESAYDGYTGAFVFKCQYSSFDDSAGDGSTNRRRGMSVAPNTPIPARRCIDLASQKWLVGQPTDDSFLDKVTRQNYNLKKVTDSVAVLTPAQACLASAGVDVHVQKYYFKDTVNALTDSDYNTFWNIFFAANESVSKGAFLRDTAGLIYRVRQKYAVAEGFTVAQSDELDTDARQTGVVFDTGVYNPLTDTTSAGTVFASVLQFEVPKFYRFRQQQESVVMPGDRMVFVAPSQLAAPKIGGQFTMQALRWRIVALQLEKDAWALHVRLA